MLLVGSIKIGWIFFSRVFATVETKNISFESIYSMVVSFYILVLFYINFFALVSGMIVEYF